MAYLSVPKISRHLIFLHLSSPFIVDNCSYISILSFAITYLSFQSISELSLTHLCKWNYHYLFTKKSMRNEKIPPTGASIVTAFFV